MLAYANPHQIGERDYRHAAVYKAPNQLRHQHADCPRGGGNRRVPIWEPFRAEIELALDHPAKRSQTRRRSACEYHALPCRQPLIDISAECVGCIARFEKPGHSGFGRLATEADDCTRSQVLLPLLIAEVEAVGR